MKTRACPRADGHIPPAHPVHRTHAKGASLQRGVGKREAGGRGGRAGMHQKGRGAPEAV